MAQQVGRGIELAGIPARLPCQSHRVLAVVKEQRPLVRADAERLVDREIEPERVFQVSEPRAVEDVLEMRLEAELVPEIGGAMVLLSGGEIELDIRVPRKAPHRIHHGGVDMRVLLEPIAQERIDRSAVSDRRQGGRKHLLQIALTAYAGVDDSA